MASDTEMFQIFSFFKEMSIPTNYLKESCCGRKPQHAWTLLFIELLLPVISIPLGLQISPCIPRHIPLVGPGSYPQGQADDM